MSTLTESKIIPAAQLRAAYKLATAHNHEWATALWRSTFVAFARDGKSREVDPDVSAGEWDRAHPTVCDIADSIETVAARFDDDKEHYLVVRDSDDWGGLGQIMAIEVHAGCASTDPHDVRIEPASGDIEPVFERLTVEAIRANTVAYRRGDMAGIDAPDLAENDMIYHTTGTGRLSWAIDVDGHASLTVSRPSGDVLTAEVCTAEVCTDGEIEVTSLCDGYHRRHVRVLEDALAALLPRGQVLAACESVGAAALSDAPPMVALNPEGATLITDAPAGYGCRGRLVALLPGRLPAGLILPDNAGVFHVRTGLVRNGHSGTAREYIELRDSIASQPDPSGRPYCEISQAYYWYACVPAYGTETEISQDVYAPLPKVARDWPETFTAICAANPDIAGEMVRLAAEWAAETETAHE